MPKPTRKIPVESTQEDPNDKVVELHPKEDSGALTGTSSRDLALSAAIETCWETYRLLASSATRLASQNLRNYRGSINLLWDAAESAKWTAEFLLRDSPSSLLIASICAEVCDDVADELESRYEEQEERTRNPDISLILDCAEKARLLADTCDQLADEAGFEIPGSRFSEAAE
jgi:hypothetical protein